MFTGQDTPRAPYLYRVSSSQGHPLRSYGRFLILELCCHEAMHSCSMIAGLFLVLIELEAAIEQTDAQTDAVQYAMYNNLLHNYTCNIIHHTNNTLLHL